ncbi:hypothetical protein Poli38472_006575 [Pythium oligandrum]|uniref:Uncharacterized protein n=1 Tax=Pythium oligandrum TaxID=41045 RepID=A0A8K1FAT8_PYTOL|nr:hypothetical protein Poli38472_006575 [Pythium oligandrum]|eukprot:TMW56565.1 hypothetical protein Poli38472_006575 [Pythium oligandrum]
MNAMRTPTVVMGRGSGPVTMHGPLPSPDPSVTPTSSTVTLTRPALRMLKVLERASGICLFTKQWQWHPQGQPEGVDALVQSFTQFAREIDGGDIVRVHFDTRTAQGSSTSIGSISATPKGQSLSGEEERRPAQSTAIEMLSHETENLHVVLFHDRFSDETTVQMRVFLNQIVQCFVDQYGNDVANFRANTPSSSTPTDQLTDLLAPFRSFEDVVEKELLPTLVLREQW